MATWGLNEAEVSAALDKMSKKLYIASVNGDSTAFNLDDAAVLTQASAMLNFIGTTKEPFEKDGSFYCQVCSAKTEEDWFYCARCGVPIR